MRRIIQIRMLLAAAAAMLFLAACGEPAFSKERNAGKEYETEAFTPDESGAGLKKGRVLKRGDCIGITAPAYFIQDNDFNQSVSFLRSLGYKVKVTPSCLSRDRYFAGSDRERAEDLNELFRDDSVDAILCLRGGYGCARILDYLDYEMIKAHPKLLIGYSDVTALHVALMQRCGLATVHGPMASSFCSIYSDYVQQMFLKQADLKELLKGSGLPGNGKIDLKEISFKDTPMEYTVTQFTEGITSDKPIGEIDMPKDKKLEALVPGTAAGVVTGGNLTVLDSLIGTEYELQADHMLLFIEEVGEDAYRIDRMLRHLLHNGLLDRVDGILVGDMSSNRDQETGTVDQVLKEYAELAGKPCITGVPAGHGKDNMFLPFGVSARMTANEDGTASLTFLEPVLTR